MTKLVWNLPQDQTVENGIDRGVIYVEDGSAVAWSGLSSVEDAGESTTSEFYLDGIKYLAVVSPRDWKGVLSAFTYPREFGELIGVSELADGLYADSQASDQFGLSYRTIVSTPNVDKKPQYKIHLIYKVMAAPSGFTHQTLSADAVDPISFEFDLSAVPISIPGKRPTAHIILDTRDMDSATLIELESMIYGDDTQTPSLPTIDQLIDLLKYSDGVIVVDNGDGTWTATGSNKDIYPTDDFGHFQIDNVAAEYLSDEVYEFIGVGGSAILALDLDTDGIPYFVYGEDMSHVDVDTDGIPYYTEGPSDTSLYLDEDGVLYFK